jgi:hypothetical protein
MAIIIPIPSASVEAAVGSSSTTFALTLDGTSYPQGVALYEFVANVDSWICQGASPTASAGAGSMFVPANVPVIIDGVNGAALAVIQDSTSGRAALTPIQRF